MEKMVVSWVRPRTYSTLESLKCVDKSSIVSPLLAFFYSLSNPSHPTRTGQESGSCLMFNAGDDAESPRYAKIH